MEIYIYEPGYAYLRIETTIPDDVSHTLSLYKIISDGPKFLEEYIPNTIARTSEVIEQIDEAIKQIDFPKSDWNQKDSTKASYIKNKPEITAGKNYFVLTDIADGCDYVVQIENDIKESNKNR